MIHCLGTSFVSVSAKVFTPCIAMKKLLLLLLQFMQVLRKKKKWIRSLKVFSFYVSFFLAYISWKRDAIKLPEDGKAASVSCQLKCLPTINSQTSTNTTLMWVEAREGDRDEGRGSLRPLAAHSRHHRDACQTLPCHCVFPPLPLRPIKSKAIPGTTARSQENPLVFIPIAFFPYSLKIK